MRPKFYFCGLDQNQLYNLGVRKPGLATLLSFLFWATKFLKLKTRTINQSKYHIITRQEIINEVPILGVKSKTSISSLLKELQSLKVLSTYNFNNGEGIFFNVDAVQKLVGYSLRKGNQSIYNNTTCKNINNNKLNIINSLDTKAECVGFKKFYDAFPKKLFQFEKPIPTPHYVDIDFLIERVRASQFLFKNPRQNFTWCIKPENYNKICTQTSSGRYYYDEWNQPIKQKSAKTQNSRDYSPEELNNLFDDLDDLKI